MQVCRPLGGDNKGREEERERDTHTYRQVVRGGPSDHETKCIRHLNSKQIGYSSSRRPHQVPLLSANSRKLRLQFP